MKLTYISPVCEVIDVEIEASIAAGSPIDPERVQNVDDEITGGIGAATGNNGGDGWIGLSKGGGYTAWGLDWDDDEF